MLRSAFKSAKGLFATSASTSAAAKLEAHNSPSRLPRRDISNESKTAAVFNMPGALYSERQLPQSPFRTKSVTSLLSTSPSRKTRSSNESDKKREKEMKAQQKAADELEKAREKELLGGESKVYNGDRYVFTVGCQMRRLSADDLRAASSVRPTP